MPLVTVITPSFNQGRFIEQTIQSVLAQDYPNVQYIVVDGGSTDETLDILKKYQDFLTWTSEKDRGQTDAINKGIRKAQGEIVCWLNSDDTYEPGAIRTAVECFNTNPDVMLVYGEGNEIDVDGSFLHRFPATQSFDLWSLCHIHDYILQPTTFFKKAIFDEIDYPCESLNWCMDWDLWIRIGKRFKVAYVSCVLANSRIYNETKTGSGGIRRLREIVHIMRKHGRRKYPLGCFLYGTDSFETICRSSTPKLYFFLSPVFQQVRRFLSTIQHRYQGFYADGWLGKEAHFMLPMLSENKTIFLQLDIPHAVSPCTVEVYLADQKKTVYSISSPGMFELSIPNERNMDDMVELQLTFSKAFRPVNDRRLLTCRLIYLKY